jgi:hypothetical protein
MKAFGAFSHVSLLLLRATMTLMLTVGVVAAHGQGTITFDAHPNFGGTSYYELGMWIRIANPVPYYGMGVVGPITSPSSIPYNSTPYMGYIQQSSNDYAVFSLTNGSAFGLTSVQLVDPNSPSDSLLPISFVGFKPGGLTVTNTLTTPGNGADHLLNYQFNSDFASGLTRVEIPSARWAIDNLVFTVPEPSSAALVSLGLLALILRGPRASCTKARGAGAARTR